MPMGGELGIKRGEIWAYKLRLVGPLVPARVVSPGTHYGAEIEIIILEGPTERQRVSTHRARLPCLWDEREKWLTAHPEFRRELPPQPAEVEDPFELPADVLFGMGEKVLRRIIREELQAVLSIPPKLSYTYKEAARATGMSESAIRAAVRNYDLTPVSYNSKPLFTEEELRSWVKSFKEVIK